VKRTHLEVERLFLVKLDKENGLLVVRRHELALLEAAGQYHTQSASFRRERAEKGKPFNSQSPRIET
jgi:hypothetical protein